MRWRPRWRRRIDVIITGGGTAGHVLPALSIGRALVALGHRQESIHFVGSRRGLETKLLEGSGFFSTLLPGRGIVRRARPANLVALAGLSVAFVRALVLVVISRPGAVVCVGGYAGLPCSLAAALVRIPIVVVSVDAVPGGANRLVARFAKYSAVAFPDTALPRAVHTGAPLRDDVLRLAKEPDRKVVARTALGLNVESTVVALTGGSLGAWRINQAGLGLARALSGRAGLVLYHVTGARDFDRVSATASSLGLSSALGVDYRIVSYEEHLPELLAASDLVIGRAGAMTVAELAALGTPSILVPLPGAPGDHQRANAKALADAGAAIVLDDADTDADALLSIITPLLSDPGRLDQMARAARTLGRLDATRLVADLVEDALSPKRRRVANAVDARATHVIGTR